MLESARVPFLLITEAHNHYLFEALVCATFASTNKRAMHLAACLSIRHFAMEAILFSKCIVLVLVSIVAYESERANTCLFDTYLFFLCMRSEVASGFQTNRDYIAIDSLCLLSLQYTTSCCAEAVSGREFSSRQQQSCKHGAGGERLRSQCGTEEGQQVFSGKLCWRRHIGQQGGEEAIRHRFGALRCGEDREIEAEAREKRLPPCGLQVRPVQSSALA